MWRISLAILLLGLIPAIVAGRVGEDSWENLRQLRAGQKIEVVDMNLKMWGGTLLSVSDEVIVLGAPKGDVSVKRADVLRVSLKEHSRRGRNAAIGMGIGAGAGIPFSIICAKLAHNEGGNPAACIAGSEAVFSGIGAGIGALFPGYKTIYRAQKRRGSKTP